MGDMDAILDQALDDLEGIEAATNPTPTSIAHHNEEAKKTSDISEANKQGSSTTGKKNAEPVDTNEFFQYLMQGGDDDENESETDRDAKLENFMKHLQNKLSEEIDKDGNDNLASDGKDDKASDDVKDDDVAATLASILEQMATVDNDDPQFPSEGDRGVADFNPDDIVNGMMEQLLSKDLMYEPMKMVADHYPEWLETNRDTLSNDDLEKYTRQFQCFKRLVYQYETDPGDVNSLMQLMQDAQEFGQPPKGILEKVAPNLELDEEGMPNMNVFEALGGSENGDCSVM